MHLQHRLHGQARLRQGPGGARRGGEGKALLHQPAGHRHQGGFIAVVGGEEHRARGGKGLAGGQFRLGVGQAEA